MPRSEEKEKKANPNAHGEFEEGAWNIDVHSLDVKSVIVGLIGAWPKRKADNDLPKVDREEGKGGIKKARQQGKRIDVGVRDENTDCLRDMFQCSSMDLSEYERENRTTSGIRWHRLGS